MKDSFFSVLGAKIQLGKKHGVESSLPFVWVHYDDLDSTGDVPYCTYFRGYVSVGTSRDYRDTWSFEVDANKPEDLDSKARDKVYNMYRLLGKILEQFPSSQTQEDPDE